MHSQNGLIAHWPLIHDERNAAGIAPVVNNGVTFDAAGPGGALPSAARFNGRNSFLELKDPLFPKLGRGTMSVAVWLKSPHGADLSGDVLSKFDGPNRTGFSLIALRASATVSQANQRNIHFGIDHGQERGAWQDCGRPGQADFILAMCVHGGALYAGTFEWNGKGHVYRYAGEGRWLDCGAPAPSNAITSLAAFQGDLYCGVGCHRAQGSLWDPSPNQEPGGRVYRYAGGAEWIDCGQIGEEADCPSCFTVFKGKLFANNYHHKGVYEYQGDRRWASVGLDSRLISMTVYHDELYGIANGKQVFRYDGESRWSTVAELPDSRQNYGAMAYRGELYVGTWPEASIHRCGSGGDWSLVTKRIDCEREVMGMNVYNGKLYCGTLPTGSVYRYEDDGSWSFLGNLIKDSNARLRRVWSMCVHDGKLYAGTFPSGKVHSWEAGRMASLDEAFPDGWHHLAAVKANGQLRLYLDGAPVASSSPFHPADFDLNCEIPLRIGHGVHDYFHGEMCGLRVYDRALEEWEIGALAAAKG